MRQALFAAAAAFLAAPALASAQDAPTDHSGHQMAPVAPPAPTDGAEPPSPHAGHDMAAQPGMEGMDHAGHGMAGNLGAYPMGRDASGTAWQRQRAHGRLAQPARR